MELTWHPDYPSKAIVFSFDNAVRLINPTQGKVLATALVGSSSNTNPILHAAAFLPQRNMLYILAEGGNKSLDIMHYDANLNPCKLRDIWKEEKWDVGITAVALYDYIASIVVPEKELAFSIKKKKTTFSGKATFLIAGRRDGTICKIDMKTGSMGYRSPCHTGAVTKIIVNPALGQFVSAGVNPGIRLWKILFNQDEEFTPLLDISWKYPIIHICLAYELVGFALSHPDAPSHKLVVFNNLHGQRYDHQAHCAHGKPILSVSASKELLLFCTASLDETVRIWSSMNELIRVLCLNWVPHYAAFSTKQGDIWVGIGHQIHLIPAEKYLTMIYRNRVILNGLNAGQSEEPVPLNAAKSGQDPRMIVALEEQANARETSSIVKTPNVFPNYKIPQDSQRAKNYELLRLRDEDLKLIVQGNHPLATNIPDPHNLTKQEWDEFGKSVFGKDGEDRKFFVSESRQACINKIKENQAELAKTDD